MIPFCSRFDSVLFTPKMPAIAGCFNFSRSPKGIHTGTLDRLRRVKDYWGKDLPVNIGRANFDELRFEYFRDSTRQVPDFRHRCGHQPTSICGPMSRGSRNSRPMSLAGSNSLGAHHLRRTLQSQGHDSRLMPAKYVRP
jgi:hypothetical protein